MTENPKKRILDLVAQGIITSEEALDLLEHLEDESVEEKLETFEEEVANIVEDSSDEVSKDNLTSRLTQLSASLNQLTQDTVNKIKQMRNPSTFEKELISSFDDVDSLFIDYPKGNIAIVLDDQRQDVEVKQEFTMVSTENHLEEWIESNWSMKQTDSILRIKSNKKTASVKLTVTLPAKDYSIMDIKLVTGDVSLTGVSLDDLSIEIGSGCILLHDTQAQSVQTTIKDGRIDVEARANQINSSNHLGTTSLIGTFDKVIADSRSGDIVVKNASETCQQMILSTRTGDVKVALPETIGLTGQVSVPKENFKSLLDVELDESSDKDQTISKAGEQQVLLDLKTRVGYIYMKGL